MGRLTNEVLVQQLRMMLSATFICIRSMCRACRQGEGAQRGSRRWIRGGGRGARAPERLSSGRGAPRESRRGSCRSPHFRVGARATLDTLGPTERSTSI